MIFVVFRRPVQRCGIGNTVERKSNIFYITE